MASMILSQNTNDNPNTSKRRRITWLLRAELNAYQYQGQTLYEPVCSPLLQLQNTPNCPHCGAKRFQYEPPTFCCYKGEIILADSTVPKDLFDLFSSDSIESIEFRKNIRAYSSIFSFTSFGVNLDKDLAITRRGVYTFRVQGQIYHHLPSLRPNENGPSYFQLYFYDTNSELKNRMRIIPGVNLNLSIVEKLMKVLQENPYAQFLRRLKDYPSFEDLQIRITKHVNLDQRVYNSPSSDEVAAIWVEGNNTDIPFEREILVLSHSRRSHRVKHYFGCYDPLQYPLLFPKGEVGWHQNIKKRNVHSREQQLSPGPNISTFRSTEEIFEREEQDVGSETSANVSCRAYYAHKLQIRDNRQSTLLLAGKLLQQYSVDMYIKLETTRLDYYRNQQSKIRAELYQGVVDSVTAGETRGNKVGQRIVLPASFVGGPRDMRRRYLDAMALVQRFGKPDLFITMTCNPEWKEIKDNLKEGQHPQDRPDLISRVFRAKLKDLKDQLFQKEIFGKVAAHVHVIKFQKRGLPHAHILLIMKHEYKILTPDQYNKFICAEIPDEREYPQLHNLVVKHMMHGPCGEFNQNSPCMFNGECRFHYPREFSSTTMQGKDSYPIYRRRNDKRQVQVRNKILDNRWVVPYNPYLLTRYNCHINVEICSGLKAVKYLYKYIYKGHNRVAIQVSFADDEENVVDEIQQFQDARWVSAQEAIWRIFEFELNEIQPPVINLQLHLPNKHSVSFGENQNLENVFAWHNVSNTMLTEYFNMCSKNINARKYLYREFPEHYVWDKQAQLWTKRKRGVVMGPVNGANPAEGERYYLRLLLNHVPGADSYNYLKTFEGTRYLSFKEAAQKRGLLESDESIAECLCEAITFQMPQALRRLFAIILVYCEPSDVRKLWEANSEYMSEDFKRIHPNSTNIQLSCTLNNIRFFLESMGKTIKDYDLPVLNSCQATTSNPLLREISAYLNILDRVTSGKSGAFFVDGPGGTGKTYLYKALLASIRMRGMIALATATSGVAATIMPGGRTTHSRFKIPILANETSLCNISKQSGIAELIRRSKLIIWDEAPMTKRFAVETLDRTLKDLMDSMEIFGGKVVVFGGDFRQVLPVVRRGTRLETVNASLVKSRLWPHMQILTLKTNMSARADPNFSDFLLRIGNGDEHTHNDDMISIPKEMIINCERDYNPEKQLIDIIFPSLDQNAHLPKYLTDRAILATTNEQVDKLNDMLIAMFPGNSKVFNSFDEAVDDTHNYYQEEFLNSLMPNGLPPHKLEIKPNCPIILLRNLDPSNGLCNGTRMIYKSCFNNVIHAEISVGQHAGKQVLLPRIPLSPAENEGYPFQFRRKQFPIRLCFAMTINKSQGQTIPHVGVYLPEHVFSHGKLYVALSRGTSMSTTKVLLKTQKSTTKNTQKTLCTKKFSYQTGKILKDNMSTGDIPNEQYVPINKLEKFQTQWKIKVKVLQRGSIDSYSTVKGSGNMCKVILIDEEGTKVQTIMFNDVVTKFEELLLKDKTYLVANGVVKSVNSKYSHIHDKIELSLTKYTEVKEVENEFVFKMSLYNFISLKEVTSLKDTNISYDVIGFVINVKPIHIIRKSESNATSKMREITMKDTDSESLQLTLWGDLAEHEGKLLEDLINEYPLIALSNVKGSIYEGEFRLTTVSTTIIQINPDVKQAKKMREWLIYFLTKGDKEQFLSPKKKNYKRGTNNN